MKLKSTILFLILFCNYIYSAEQTFLDYTNKNINDYLKTQDKIIILNFWATFCSPCITEISDLVKIQNDYKDKVIVIGASLDNSKNLSLIKRIAESLKINYPILYGVNPVFDNESIQYIPKTYIIYKNKIIEKIEGKRDYNFFKDKIIKIN